MNELEKLRSELEAEKSQLLARLGFIDDMLNRMGATLPIKMTPAVARALASGPDDRIRAPRNSLQNAIKDLVSRKPGLQNSEIREALKASGYQWSLNPEHVSKILHDMAAAKELKTKRAGRGYAYFPAK